MRAGALKSALSQVRQGRPPPRRRALRPRRDQDEGAPRGARRAQGAGPKTLVVDCGDNEKLKLSIRNCKTHQFLPPEGVNVYDLLRHDTLILSQGRGQGARGALPEAALREASGPRRSAMTPEQVIRRPIILTEKATLLREQNNQVDLRGRPRRQQDSDQATPFSALQGQRHRRQHDA